MQDCMQYDPIQGQGHEPLKVGNQVIFKSYLRHLQWELATYHGFRGPSSKKTNLRNKFISRVLLRLCAPADYVIRLLDLSLHSFFFMCVSVFLCLFFCLYLFSFYLYSVYDFHNK